MADARFPVLPGRNESDRLPTDVCDEKSGAVPAKVHRQVAPLATFPVKAMDLADLHLDRMVNGHSLERLDQQALQHIEIRFDVRTNENLGGRRRIGCHLIFRRLSMFDEQPEKLRCRDPAAAIPLTTAEFIVL
jgi:hypothetical protein